MKRNTMCLLLLFILSSLFAQNAVDYRKKWESRNALIYEKGNELWDIYVNEYPLTKGTIYEIEYCIEKKECNEKKSTFEGWYIHDEYHLWFDNYDKVRDFMDALTQAYLRDKSILKTEQFIQFTEKRFNYHFKDNKYYDYESKEKKYRIGLIADDAYSAAINVYKTFYGNCESTEYVFVYSDYETHINYWVEDFEADIFFLHFTNFYTDDYDGEFTLQDYFETLSGDFVEAEGMNGTMTVESYDMETLYRAFRNDILYSIISSVMNFIKEEDSSESVIYIPANF